MLLCSSYADISSLESDSKGQKDKGLRSACVTITINVDEVVGFHLRTNYDSLGLPFDCSTLSLLDLRDKIITSAMQSAISVLIRACISCLQINFRTVTSDGA